MPYCKEFEAVIWEAAETGTVPVNLTEHFAACGECRKAFEELSDAMDGFAALQEVPSPDLTDAVMAMVYQPVRRTWLIPALAGGLAACCAALAIFLFAWQRPEPPSRHAAPTVAKKASEKPGSIVTAGAANTRKPEKQTPKHEPSPQASARSPVRQRNRVRRQPIKAVACEPTEKLSPNILTACPQATMIVRQIQPPPHPKALLPTYCDLEAVEIRIVSEPKLQNTL